MLKSIAEYKGGRREQQRCRVDTGYVIKKNNKRGARHGLSERQRMAKEMLHKARQEKHEKHSSILARWHNDYHLRENDYSFDALQTYCFRILYKTVMTVIFPGADFFDFI